jgi:hypothetical protein
MVTVTALVTLTLVPAAAEGSAVLAAVLESPLVPGRLTVALVVVVVVVVTSSSRSCSLA